MNIEPSFILTIIGGGVLETVFRTSSELSCLLSFWNSPDWYTILSDHDKK